MSETAFADGATYVEDPAGPNTSPASPPSKQNHNWLYRRHVRRALQPLHHLDVPYWQRCRASPAPATAASMTLPRCAHGGPADPAARPLQWEIQKGVLVITHR
jgi:hypothetical protein